MLEARSNPKLVLRRSLQRWGQSAHLQYESYQDSRGAWRSHLRLEAYGLLGVGGPRKTKAGAEREAAWTILQQLQDWILWV